MKTGAKMKKVEGWSYDEREVKDSVQTALPDGMTLRFFHVTSGDSGEKYETYLLYWGTPHKPPKAAIAWCKCQNGWYDRLPILIADLYRKTPIIASDQICKHAANLLLFLRSESE